MNKVILLLSIILLQLTNSVQAENGYDLWLRYKSINDVEIKNSYRETLGEIAIVGDSETIDVVRKEMHRALEGLLGQGVNINSSFNSKARVLIGTTDEVTKLTNINLAEQTEDLQEKGYLITETNHKGEVVTLITGKSDIGVLYGTYRLIRVLQQHQTLSGIYILSNPQVQHRILNHWDNLDRTVERGYAGFSIFDWHKLPNYKDPRYIDYARANASIGINGTVVTNVNSNALVLTPQYINKLTGLANIFRPYGIKVYLTARFSAPMEIGGLKSADPTLPEVQNWWNEKAREIYEFIPDFGGFLVKANSEGQPGPQDYGRSHAEGANMLADAVAPYGGIVMWRAFVYSHEAPDDRAKQAYAEFKPLDGTFRKNVMIQVKNGAIDFQPREPFHPLFGATPKTPLMMEFQITQEYTGCATHLFYQAPLFKEVLDADTYVKGEGSTVAKVIDGSLYNNSPTGIAGVANIGNDINWTGHPFAQANWYAFGRLAWNHELTSEQIAQEWLSLTFSTQADFINRATDIMIQSREALVNYMTPLGLHHIMARNHHYGPGPWVDGGRPDWTSLYYHKADKEGIGFDRSTTGSNAISQYAPEVQNIFNDVDSCPEELLLWFHHVSWDKKMKSGNTLWDEICYRYYAGVDSVFEMRSNWISLKEYVDEERFLHVSALLDIQVDEAIWWRDACVLYFQQFSGKPIPEGLEKPEHKLEYYMAIENRFVPGIKNE